MDRTTPHWNHHLYGEENFEIILICVVCYDHGFSGPVDVIRETSGASYASSLLFGLMFFFLFSLENLQAAVNGAWGED